MAKITYANKVFLNENADIPDENKVGDSDLNEIKEVVNANDDMVMGGWNSLPIQVTISPSTYSPDVKTVICKTSVDLTSYLSVGMKVKLKQIVGDTKYAFITKITATEMTLYLGNDFNIISDPITDFYYSMLKTPYGFPMERESWDITKEITEPIEISNPINGTYYTLSGVNITVPIGEWEVGWQANVYSQRNGSGTNEQQSQLSTSTTTESNPELAATIYATGDITKNLVNIGKSHSYYFDAETTFNFIVRTTQSNMTSIGIYANNSYGYATLYAKCQYL